MLSQHMMLHRLVDAGDSITPTDMVHTFLRGLRPAFAHTVEALYGIGNFQVGNVFSLLLAKEPQPAMAATNNNATRSPAFFTNPPVKPP